MSYRSTIEYLYGLQKFGMKFGLDNITKLLAAAGNPQLSFRAVHVAGTNGKGSTSAMVESILRSCGAKTGLFTSPHLVNFTERIRIDGKEIKEQDVIDLADEVRSISEKMEDLSPTFFEVVTAMSFLHFKKMRVDWAVVEAGLGGRLDATNVLMPEVSVITNIGFDHREFLGRTLEEIAGEKAGIIKEGVSVVAASQSPEVMEVIDRRASEKGARLFKYMSDFSSKIVSDDLDGCAFNYSGKWDYEDIKLPLPGDHQVTNASMAIKTFEIISAEYPDLKCDVRKGLESVKWPGRIDMIKDNPPILIDGAHNPPAALALSIYLKKLLASKYNRIILVIGVMADKDIDGILDPLLPLASKIIFAAPPYGRAASPDQLLSAAVAKGYSSVTAATVAEAIIMAEHFCLPGDLIVITGSFYTIGEAKEVLGHNGVLSRLRE